MASSSNQNMGALPLSFPLLNGENYDFWCVTMKTQLMSNDVWEYVQDGFEDYEGVETLTNEQKKQLKVDNRMNAKALSMIQQEKLQERHNLCSAVLSLLVFSLSLSLCGQRICGSEGVVDSLMAVTDLWCGSEGRPNNLKGSESISCPYQHSLSLGFVVHFAAVEIRKVCEAPDNKTVGWTKW